MSRKPTMQVKYDKVIEDLRAGRYKTVELACKANKISPASYHIYRKRAEMLGASGEVSSPAVPKPRFSGEEDASSLRQIIASLQEKVEKLEATNKTLKDTILTLLK